MFDRQTTRLQYGVTNTNDSGIFSDLPTMDDAKMHQYLEDFDYFTVGNYTVTKTGAGTTALANGDGGLLLLTNTAASADLITMQKVGASFQLANGLRTWCKHIIQVDSNLADVIAGLVNVTTTPFTAGQITDGVWFSHSGAGSAIVLNIAVGGVTTSATLSGTLVAGSPVNLLWYWDGSCYGPQGRIVYTASGAGISARSVGEILLPVGTTFPGAVNLTPTLGVRNSTAVVRTMTIDQVYVIKDRFNILASPAF